MFDSQSRFIDGKNDHFKKTYKNRGWDSVAACLSSMYTALGSTPKVGKKGKYRGMERGKSEREKGWADLDI